MIMIGFRGQGRETLEKTEMSSKTNGPIKAPAERMRSYRQRQRFASKYPLLRSTL
jgi:hypothetical protein